MPTITPTYYELPGDAVSGSFTAAVGVKWSPMVNGDVGAPIPARYANFVDRTFQVEGTFGSGGSVAIEGSNDITFGDNAGAGNWRGLTDPQGVAIAVTGAGIKQVTEAVAQMRPHVTAGDGTTSLTVTATIRRSIR